jgi:hypothetical protein
MIVTERLELLVPDDLAQQLAQDVAAQAITDIADYARAFWIHLAQEGLVESQSSYIAGIQEVETVPGDPLARAITLSGAMPNAIENDQSAYDMHNTLLGPNVPVVKRGSGMKGKYAKKGGGYYRPIPFAHTGPKSVGATGTPIGRPFLKQGGNAQSVEKMAKRIFDAAKKLSPTTGMPGQKITYGGRLPAGMAPKLQPHHKTDIYAGMIRQQKTYKKATQSTYTTFRTISTGSRGWIRAATKGRKFAQRTAEEVKNSIAPGVFKQILGGK